MFNGIIFNQGKVDKVLKRKKGINLFIKSMLCFLQYFLKANLPLSVGFINIPAFLIFIPITTIMARIGASTVHKIEKNKISKLFGIFLIIVASKFLYDYFQL